MAFGGTGFGASAPLFGSTPTPAFGASQPQASSLFGQQQQQQQPGFAQQQPAFGSAAAPLFAQQQPQSAGLFGAAAPTTAPTGPTGAFGAFGAPASTPAFGSSAPGAFGAFGATQAQPGSRAVPYQLSTIHDQGSSSTDAGKYLAISAMDAYRDRSFEELRLQDYSHNDRGGDAPITNPPASNPVFGAQQQQPAQSSSLFGQPQQNNLFASNTASAFGAQQSTTFGAPQSTAGLFGAQSAPAFGAQSTPAFGAQSASAFGAQSTPAFGAQSTSAFGAQSASAFGAATTPSLFGAPQSAPSTNLFAAQSAPSSFGAAGSLFGSSAPAAGTGLFGASTPAPASGAGLFGASAPATGSTSAFGASFGGATGAFGAAPTSAPSLFGSTGSAFGAAPASTGAGLFGSSSAPSLGFGNTGAGLFGAPAKPSLGFGGQTGGLFSGNTGGSLFGATQSAFANTGLGGNNFGTGLGGFGLDQNPANQPLQQQGPLQTSLAQNPFGDSKLFANLTLPPASMTAPSSSVVNTAPDAGQAQSKKVSVVLGTKHRHSQPSGRARSSHVLARQISAQRRGPGSGWFNASPMRSWSPEGSLFNMGSGQPTGRFAGPGNAQRYYSQWRTSEQIQRAANIKRLVIEPPSGESKLPSATPLGRSSLTTPRTARFSHPVADVTNPTERTRSQPADDNDSTQVALIAQGSERGAGPKSYTPRPSGRSSLRSKRGHDPDEAVAVEDEVQATEVKAEPYEEDEVEEVEAAEEEDEEVEGYEEDIQNSSRVKRPENSPALYAPYSEYYKGQMSASRRRSSLGNGSSPGPTYDLRNVPKCTGSDVYTQPSLQEMGDMTEEELKFVEDFTVGRKNIGEITWLTPTDVRGLDLDRIVQINPREISIYPDDGDVPPVGTGLNKPARIQLMGVWKNDKKTKKPLKDASSTAAIVSKLKSHCEQQGLTFLGYDSRSGTWTFQANCF